MRVAILLFVVITIFPFGVIANNDNLIDELSERAKAGDAQAQYELATVYRNRANTQKDYEKVLKWYREAANQGHANAQFDLSTLFDGGVGVPQDDEKAVYWCEMAARQGNLNAQLMMGFRYEEGLGVPKNYVEAEKWFQKAAEQGHEGAKIRLSAYSNSSQASIGERVEELVWSNDIANAGEYFLKGPTSLKKGEKFVINVSKNIPMKRDIQKLCFSIGYVDEDKGNAGLESLLERVFGKEDYEKGTDGVLFYTPQFIEGAVTDIDGTIYKLTGERELVTNYPIQHKVKVNVCSSVITHPERIIKIAFLPLQSFKVDRVFWYTSD